VKWYNLNFEFKFSINSGAALILYLLNFHILTIESAYFPAIERLYPVAVGALTGAFAGFLVKRHANNKLENTQAIEEMKIAPCKEGFDATPR
jgi:positive regulator of sigma E activity